jgi:hypothetical protein
MTVQIVPNKAPPRGKSVDNNREAAVKLWQKDTDKRGGLFKNNNSAI